MNKQIYLSPAVEELNIRITQLLNSFSMDANMGEWTIEEEVDVNAGI